MNQACPGPQLSLENPRTHVDTGNEFQFLIDEHKATCIEMGFEESHIKYAVKKLRKAGRGISDKFYIFSLFQLLNFKILIALSLFFMPFPQNV